MVDRVVIGNFDGANDFRFRVSRSGYDVFDTGLLPSQLVFDSIWTTSLIVYLSGSFTIPANSGLDSTGTGVTFTSLGFPPMYLVNMVWSGSDRFVISPIYKLHVTNTQLNWQVKASVNSAVTVYYYLFLGSIT